MNSLKQHLSNFSAMKFLYSSLLLVAILFSANTSVSAQSETELQELYQGVLKQTGLTSEIGV